MAAEVSRWLCSPWALRACGALVLGGLAACGGPQPADTLFPLEAGHRWVYDVRSQWENNTTEREERVITTESRVTLDQIAPPGPAYRRRSADGLEWYLRSDAAGIYRVASKTDLEAEPVKDASPRFVLKTPFQVGTTWQATTPAYLLRRRQEFPPEIRHTHQPVVMTYAIEALGETVEVPAGRFERCLRVRGKAVMKLFADPVAGWRDMPLTTTEWYCPGPGLVRLTRDEPAQSTFLVGGSMTMELTQWN